MTLTGLPKGVEYKVQMRSRYHDGQYAGTQSWSGPWTEVATQRVKADPPSAPTGLSASLDGKGGVALSWTDPSDTAVAGYQILRGPDADQLEVIVEDTGVAGVSYTDPTPAVDATHVYAVKARNSDGLSQLSNIASVRTLSAPTGPLATSSGGPVTLTWDATDDANVTGYRVLRGESAGSLAVLGEDTGSTAPRYVDTSAAVETEYFYAASAVPR